jgi:hypothetical protein
MLRTLKNKKAKKIAYSLAAGVLLFSQLAFVPSAGATNYNPNDWQYWCGNYGGVKFDTGAVGTHVQGVSGGSVSLTIVDPDKTEVSNVTGSGVDITKVVIKGGNSNSGNGGNGNQYYTPPFNYNLKAPLNNGGQQADISHVIVCYDDKTTLEVIKKLLPANDTGKFNLGVDISGQSQGDTTVTNVGNNGTTGKAAIRSDRDVTISEAAYSGSDLNNYTTTIACVYQNGDPVNLSNVDVTGDGRDAKITASKIDTGDDIVCTFTNTRKMGYVKVVKDVVNDNGGNKTYADFTFKVNAGDSPRSFDATTGGDGEKLVTLPAGTSFNVSEVQANLYGYATAYSGTCSGTVVEGQTQTCTVTNNDQAGKLIVKKVVVNDNGGTKDVDDFSFSVNGGQAVNFEADGQNDLTVNAGSYTVTEPAVSGYTATYNNCVGVVVPNGGSATCTITNNDNAASLTVIKKVINDNGGTKLPADFTMLVSGTDVSSNSFPGNAAGTTVTLDAGSYSVSENGLSTYAASYSSDCSGALALGEHKTCTVTNDDKMPVLVLVKQVLNYNGGDAEANDWLLKATGPTTLSGWGGAVSGPSFDAGTYTLSEHYGPSGYVASPWTCVGGSQNGNQIKIGLGQAVACAITNSDKPAKVTVVKEVINDNGGDAEADDFTLKVDGKVVVSGVEYEFDGNEWYAVSEHGGPDGYKKTSLKCWDTTGHYWDEAGNPFYAKLGHSYFCKIKNDDIAPKLTVVKDSHPDSIQVFDFTLKGAGTYKTFQLNDNGTSYPVDDDKTFYLDKGFYSVTEAEADGWYLDSIVCWGTHEYVDLDERKVVVKLDLGDEVTCKFENKKFGEVKGFKYEDVNKNGHYDEDEPKLAGWTITLEQLGDEGNELSTSTETDENGWYKFEDLRVGHYKVCEQQKDGWVQTAPDSEDGCETIYIYPGDHDFVKFGNFKLGEVIGVKFNDVNGNGMRDQNEPTLKDWTITLTKKCVIEEEVVRLLDVQNEEYEEEECQDETWTTKTDANGAYSFGNLDLGTYVVCEVQQTNWTQTAPKTEDGCVEFTVEASSHEEVVDFGNKAKPQVLSTSATTPAVLANTGASAGISLAAGLTILSALAAIHFLAVRRKSHQN